MTLFCKGHLLDPLQALTWRRLQALRRLLTYNEDARQVYVRVVVPLAVLYATFLYGSNAVYAYLSIGYIQVLKVSQAFVVYALLVLAGLPYVHCPSLCSSSPSRCEHSAS